VNAGDAIIPCLLRQRGSFDEIHVMARKTLKPGSLLSGYRLIQQVDIFVGRERKMYSLMQGITTVPDLYTFSV
jgi:hypothetical protein